MTYVVPCDGSPLHIYTRSGHRSKSHNNFEAFLSPRWGGVVISNSPPQICQKAINTIDEADEIIPNEVTVMGIFLAQLRLLLGIPEPVS